MWRSSRRRPGVDPQAACRSRPPEPGRRARCLRRSSSTTAPARHLAPQPTASWPSAAQTTVKDASEASDEALEGPKHGLVRLDNKLHLAASGASNDQMSNVRTTSLSPSDSLRPLAEAGRTEDTAGQRIIARARTPLPPAVGHPSSFRRDCHSRLSIRDRNTC